MKKNIRKKLSENKGITLVALVVTLIVLLILAGVALSAVLSQDGIFHRANQATDKYGQAKAREILEMALGEAQMQKYEEGLNDEELDEQIKKVGSLLPKEDPDSKYQLVIVEGYIFEIDRSVPKVVDYKGPADGIIITASVKQNGDWKNPVATVAGTITKYGGGTVVSSSASATNGVTIPSDFPTAGGSYTISNITTDTDITITAKDSEGHDPVTEVIKVRLVRDTTGPIIESVNVKSVGLKMTINATANDTESGLKSLTYSITPNTVNLATGPIVSGKAEVEATTEGTYTVTITAEDNAGNISTKDSDPIKVEDGGVIKHIKIKNEGLREVNTRDIYGADVVGYDCIRTGVEWQIFYIDEEDDHRVYLIAKDFMSPPTNPTELKAGRYSQAYNWDSTMLNKYKTNLPASDATEIGKFMGKFLSDYAGASAEQDINLQLTNYLLNQTVWAEYMSKTNKSDLAFGGATLPLFQASYNDVCKTATKLEIKKVDVGYKLKTAQMNDWYSGCMAISDIYTPNRLYLIGANGDPAFGYWLASPGGDHPKEIAAVAYTGAIGVMGYGDAQGCRPVVSLKSNIQFTDNGNGTYTIN